MRCPKCTTEMVYQEHMGHLGMEICPNCGTVYLPESGTITSDPNAEKDRNTRIYEALEKQHGSSYADRCMKHLMWVESYDGHGGPGHMEYVLIQALLEALK